MESQNGWGLINSTQLDKRPFPGTNIVPVPGVQAGDVATVLLYVGKLFNERVQKLYSPGCWGWNSPTPIPGSNIYSNHCSGTAIDLNAPSFPWKLHTMTSKQKDACRSIVKDLEGVVIWGGDFSTYVDEMHFEIDATEEEVARMAKKIKEGDGDMQPAPFWVANMTAQQLLFRDLTDDEWNKYHKGKTRNQLWDEFAGSEERKKRLQSFVDSYNIVSKLSTNGVPPDTLKKIEEVKKLADQIKTVLQG